MDLKKLQKKVDKALSILSDHDDKKEQERYENLRNKVEEVQEYIDKGVNSSDISLEMYNELKECIRKFEEDRFIFIIFLVILCGLLFVGVFYITYSHFYDHWHPRPGGNIRPPYSSTTKKTSTTDKVITDTTTTTEKVNTTTKTTTKTTDKTTEKTTEKVTSGTTTTTKKTTTSSSTTTTKTTTVTTTTSSGDDDQPTDAFVTLTFDNSGLIDLNDLYPMEDSLGLGTKPTKWSLTSSLSNSSKDYVLTYYIDFIDLVDEIPENMRLDVNKLKYQLLIKKGTQNVYDTGIQDMYDYPEAEEGIRPIISGQTMNNDQSLDFELRMWLDSSAGNDQQGKKYKFKIDVTYTFEFID